MDITETGITHKEILAKMSRGDLHPLPEYMKWTVYNKLLEWLKSDKVVLVCVNSSMTSRVAYHTLTPNDLLDGTRDEKVANLPRPTNFRVDGTLIRFDFPDKVEVEKPEGKVVLRFDQLMLDFIERAGNMTDNLKTINPCKIDSILFDGDTVMLSIKVDDIGNEWFRFALLSKKELDKSGEANEKA